MKKLILISIVMCFALCCAFTSVAAETHSKESLARLQGIVCTVLDIDDYPLSDAATQLTALSKKYDPQGKGIKVSVDPRIPENTYMELEEEKNMTLLDAIRQICKDDEIDFTFKDDEVVFIPLKK